MNKLSKFVEKWWSRIFMVAFIAFVAWLLVLLTSCSTGRTVESRAVKDSIVYTYKTLYRDSVRIKDSTRIATKVVTRDSVVLKIDSETGKVVGKDSWHWNDTNTDRDHIRDNVQKTDEVDSVVHTAIKKDSAIVIHKNDNKATEARSNAPIFKQKIKYVLSGVVIGILLSLGFRYRKQVMAIIRKLVIKI